MMRVIGYSSVGRVAETKSRLKINIVERAKQNLKQQLNGMSLVPKGTPMSNTPTPPKRMRKKKEYNKPIPHHPYCQYTYDMPPKIKNWSCVCDVLGRYDIWRKCWWSNRPITRKAK
jgi:hypothetical protein